MAGHSPEGRVRVRNKLAAFREREVWSVALEHRPPRTCYLPLRVTAHLHAFPKRPRPGSLRRYSCRCSWSAPPRIGGFAPGVS